MQFKYSWVFIITFKTILTYMAEVGVVVLLILTYTNTANLIEQKEVAGGQLSRIPIEVRIGFITGSVVFSYVLLAIEWRKSQLIVQSRDISYAFTSTVAYRYYAIRSYAHFCFFQQIRSSRKTKDVLSFWVYFRLKGMLHFVSFKFARPTIYTKYRLEKTTLGRRPTTVLQHNYLVRHSGAKRSINEAPCLWFPGPRQRFSNHCQ